MSYSIILLCSRVILVLVQLSACCDALASGPSQLDELHKANGQRGSFPSTQLGDWWADLDSPDGIRAGNAIKALSELPDKVLPLVRTHLLSHLPASPIDSARWIRDLDSDAFIERDRAMKELVTLGHQAEPALQKLIVNTNSVEGRRRATQLLVALEAPSRQPGRLQELRIVALLEQINTTESRELLRWLAKLPVEDQRSQDAKSALQRLIKRQRDVARPQEPPRTKTGAEQWVLIDDVGKHLKDPKALVRRGTIGFRINERSKAEAGKVNIVATYGRGYGGFERGYVLRARVDVARSTEEELGLRDLTDLEITFTDEYLEMQRIGEKDVEDLIQLLYQPQFKARLGVVRFTPGGDHIDFSGPMRKLIMLGEKARYRLEQCLVDPRIQNEVAVVLGAIGNERSVELLIDAYPPFGRSEQKEINEYGEKPVFFTDALIYLTGHQIGRDRTGTDCSSKNKELWSDWWVKEKGSFQVPREKPLSTWMPHYPNLTTECAAEGRKNFVTDYSYMGVNRR